MRKASPSSKSRKSESVNCPVKPQDYRPFKAGAAMLGLNVKEAFSEASRMWLEKRCPIVIGRGEGRGV